MTAQEKLQEIKAAFDGAEDEFDKLNLLLAWSGRIREPSEELKRDGNLVEGCQSRVWIRVKRREDCLILETYSDTRLIRGFLAILETLYNGSFLTEAEALSELDLPEYLGIRDLFAGLRRKGTGRISETIRNHILREAKEIKKEAYNK